VTIALDEIIAGREPGGHGQPAHHRFVVTIFGLYGRPCGTVIPVAALVRLMTELGYEETSVRAAISRLKKKGVLVSRRIDGLVGYCMEPQLEEHMLAGDKRIFAPTSAGVGDAWLLASFSVPESERQNRHKIRAGLARLGFGNVGSGLCIAPIRVQEEALDYVQKHGLSDYVEFFLSEPLGNSDLRAKVAQWWDLDELEREYQAFVDEFEPQAARWRSRQESDTETLLEAFQAYVPMVTHWRRLPFADPGLPPDLLPPDWTGRTARSLFIELNGILGPLSARHAQRIIHA
jgi:phenylacetic acid degradation operon negative regulatory protein